MISRVVVLLFPRAATVAAERDKILDSVRGRVRPLNWSDE